MSSVEYFRKRIWDRYKVYSKYRETHTQFETWKYFGGDFTTGEYENFEEYFRELQNVKAGWIAAADPDRINTLM